MLIQWSERSLRRSLFVDQQGGNKEELGVERERKRKEELVWKEREKEKTSSAPARTVWSNVVCLREVPVRHDS